MNDIEVAEKTLAALTDKRDRAVARTEAIADERRSIGFAVHADGDPKARKRLDQLNIDAATITSELAGIDAAIAEAQSTSRYRQKCRGDQGGSPARRRLRKTYNTFIESSAELDAALALVVENAGAMKATVDRDRRPRRRRADRPTVPNLRRTRVTEFH